MKTLRGKVVSTKMQKTIIVEVETSRPHPLYKKIVKKKKRFKAHSGNLKLKVGDRVEIAPVRPISKEKHFTVISKMERMGPLPTILIKKGKGARGKP